MNEVEKNNKKTIKDLKNLKESRHYIDLIVEKCLKYKFQVSLQYEEIKIKSKYYEWKFNVDGSKIVLEHRNYYNVGNKIINMSGYHIQQRKFEDAFEVIDYIKKHDKCVKRTENKISKEEKLWKKIERNVSFCTV